MIQSNIDLSGEHQVRDRWFHIKPGDVVYDIGCSKGIYTLYALDKGASVVHAFDVQKQELEGLRYLLTLNPGFENRCFIHHMGLYNGETKMWTFADALLEHGVDKNVTEHAIGKEQPESVVYKKMDAFAFKKFDDGVICAPPDWIKIDVESYELDVLLGGEKLLSKYHPKLIIENHTNIAYIDGYMKVNNIWNNLIGFLKSVGYNHFEEVPYHVYSHLFAEKTSEEKEKAS